MQIAPPTPIEAFNRLSKLRMLLARLRDERVNHPSVSLETKVMVSTYYGDMLEALDIGMAAVIKQHKLNIEPNVIAAALAG